MMYSIQRHSIKTAKSHDAQKHVEKSRIHPLPSCLHTLSSLIHPSTNDDSLLTRKVISRHLQIQRRRPLPRPATNVVMASMARAEPSAEISSLSDGHTS